MTHEVNIRIARGEECAALVRLAALDSATVSLGPYVVAEVEGELRAALPLEGGRAIADPFHATSDLVQLLEAWTRLRPRDTVAGEGRRPSWPRRQAFS